MSAIIQTINKDFHSSRIDSREMGAILSQKMTSTVSVF